jgi:iron complex transport system ATP-binding protein
VMIARALAQDTQIILLDEPTAHLDLNNRVEVMKLLKKLAHKMNKAILISTHELDLALQMADVIWIAGNKKNIIRGIPEDLVLSNTFDDIFQFKGFDLKTGKVQHEIHQHLAIELTGEGYEYLWTRNALERNGFAVKTGNTDLKISIHKHEERLQWEINNVSSFNSLQDVLIFLRENQLSKTP